MGLISEFFNSIKESRREADLRNEVLTFTDEVNMIHSDAYWQKCKVCTNTMVSRVPIVKTFCEICEKRNL